MNFIVIASTGGSVLAALMHNPYFRKRIRCVVSDRNCGAIEIAAKFNIPFKIYKISDDLAFSNLLLSEYRDKAPDLFVSFYTRLFCGEFLKFAKRRLVNIHPSILPACPGLDGFGDTIRSNAKFIGATIHLVDEGIDTGTPIIQAAAPYNPNKTLQDNRHTVFVQQCKMLLQLIKYVEENRLEFDQLGQPLVRGAKYEIGEFSPNLDDDLPWK
jgi:phosphoribosylglycinamide formyltransferase-1